VAHGPQNDRNRLLTETIKDFENLAQVNFPLSEHSVSLLTECGWAKVFNLEQFRSAKMLWQVCWQRKIVDIDPNPYLAMIGKSI
jgi:hypothetical protein